jgi:hypothetical protein
MGKKWLVSLACDSDYHVNHRVLYHAANLRHGIDGFTSRSKEGMLWILLPKKCTASAGFEPSVLGTRGQHANRKTNKAADCRAYCIEVGFADYCS